MTLRTMFNLSFFLILAGTALFSAGMIWRNRRKQQKVRKGTAAARVVRLELRSADESAQGIYQNRYHPVLQYYAQGQLYETVLEEGSYPSRWEKGQKVSVEYNTEDPSDYAICVKKKGDDWPDIMYYAGFVLLVAGIMLFLGYVIRR